MTKAKLKDGRQAREIGAAIVGAWLKALPVKSANILSMSNTNPLRITVDSNLFSANDPIILRDKDGSVLRKIKVNTVTAAGSNFELEIVTEMGAAIDYSGTTFQGGGAAKPAAELSLMKPDLTAVLTQIVDATVEVVFDEPGKINVVVPIIPEGVLARSDLFDYLRNYHTYGQGRQYHEELGGAVLFGCR